MKQVESFFAGMLVGIALLVLSPLIIVLVAVLLIYGYFFIRPIMNELYYQPLYWLNWHEVKRRSRARTGNVLWCLRTAAGPGGSLDCVLRPEKELVQLEKFLSRLRPTAVMPHTDEDVVFYKFRPRYTRPRRGRFVGRTLSILRPVWVPA